jgi:hypothetical protein
VPLIAKTIAETPMALNKVLRQVLEPFGKEYCFTEAIIQGVRSKARKWIFGEFLGMLTTMLDMSSLLKKTSRRLDITLNCHLLLLKQPCRIWTRL